MARFILIGLYTGTRHNAILSLKWVPSASGGWIDLDQAVIHRRGSGERETKKRRTPARIPDRLMAHLRRWHRMDMAKGIASVVSYAGQPIKKERRAWEWAVKRAGLDGLTPHALRHTCATWALNSGMEIWDVAALLGASPQMVERTYGHHSPQFQSKVRRFGRKEKMR